MSTIKPKVGMGGFHYINGDRYPFTIIEVITDKKIRVQYDDYQVVEENSFYKEGPLQCEFFEDKKAPTRIVTFRKNFQWMLQGVPMQYGNFESCYIGERQYSRNPHI